uniref:SEC20 protein n=1 Tax=Macrostomum lignano TaxID=282301 RepID=A0A1I8FUZ1_9PLAT
DGNPRVSQTLEELVRQDARLKEAIADLRSPEACRSQRDLASLESVGRECLREIRRLLRQLDGLLDAVEGDAERARVEREARNCQCSLQASQEAMRETALQRKQALQEAERRRVRQREETAAAAASHVTQSLLLLSNQLAEQVEASSETANRLLRSSEQLTETGEELKSMTGHISTAKRLLTRLSRRDFTDKVLIFLAFVFFFSTCAYIVKKRTIGVTV